MIDTQFYIKIATFFYFSCLVVSFSSSRRHNLIWFFLAPALAANGAVVVLRYHQAWPMLPMYLGPVALPFFMGILLIFITRPDERETLACRLNLTLILFIALVAVLFPKDYYLPFIKSQTLAAHAFFLFGILGRGCFLTAAAWALAGLLSSGDNHNLSTYHISTRWTVWGFAFWTLSMFAGELWSYLGWGTPVVWDDPAITTTMATWFFYICLLHLHLTGSWSIRSRSLYAAMGALVVFGLNCIPELGPLRWPL